MARLSQDNIGSVQVSTIEADTSHTWLDMLPHCCELPALFRTGKPLDECLDIVNVSKTSLNKRCRECAHMSCDRCYSSWQKAAAAMVLQMQVDKAFAGNSAMLTWYGKAVLRQQEPLNEQEDIVPSTINIVGLDADQEAEIAVLKAEIKRLRALVKEPTDGQDA